MKDKLNIVFKPFVLSLFVLIVGYTFIHWFLIIELKLFSLNRTITNFIIPLVLTVLLSLFYLQPKLKVLNIKTKGDWTSFYFFISLLFLSLPTIVAQEYIITATGKLTELNSINEINKSEPTKYYTIKNYYINKKIIGISTSFKVSGKSGQYLHLYKYIVVPIYENESDKNNQPLAWVGIKYSKKIINGLEASKEEAAYRQFVNESKYDFENKNFSDFVYFDRIGNSDDKAGFVNAVNNNLRFVPNQTILVGSNESYELRNGNKLEWIIGLLIVGSLVWLLMILIPKTNKIQLKKIKEGKI